MRSAIRICCLHLGLPGAVSFDDVYIIYSVKLELYVMRRLAKLTRVEQDVELGLVEKRRSETPFVLAHFALVDAAEVADQGFRRENNRLRDGSRRGRCGRGGG